MKVALLAILGLFLGALGEPRSASAPGSPGSRIAQTTSFEGYSGMLVFFTLHAAGCCDRRDGGALLFGLLAMRDDAIAIERAPQRTGASQDR